MRSKIKVGFLIFNYGTLPLGGGKPIYPSPADGRKQSRWSASQLLPVF